MSIDESGPNDAYLNPYYHSSRDTIDKLDFTKAAEFVKVSNPPKEGDFGMTRASQMALAFSVELAA